MPKERSLSTFNAVAREYDSPGGKYAQAGQSVHPFMMSELYARPFASVLDVGCGTGSLLAMIDNAGCRRSGIDLRTGDSENLPRPERSFDVVTCCLSFHHYEHPLAALEEMRRVLTRGGRLIIGDLWAPFPVRNLMNLLIRFDREGDVRVYSEKEMRSMLAAAGFGPIGWKSATRWSSIATAVRND